MAEEPNPQNVEAPSAQESLGEQTFGKTKLGEEAKKNAVQTSFNSQHQTAYPTAPDTENIIGNFHTGPTPGLNTGGGTNEDYVRNFVGMLGTADQWAHDKHGYGKVVSYGAGYRSANFDRYYSQSGFKKLGFSPFRDNEKIYNEKTSGYADFGRMVSGWAGMAGLGIKDMFSEWGDHGLNSDVVHSEEMAKRMSVMSSSRDSTMGWVTNFGANTAYTAGILAELAAEELGLLALTALSGGTASELTVPQMIARGGMGVKKIGEGFTAMNKIRKALSSIKSAGDARDLFSLANLGDKAVGAAKWLNPLSRTAEFAGDFSSMKNLTNFAKLKRGAGSLYRDIREINAVTSESKLEGGSVQTDLNNQLVNDFYDKHGRLPDGEDAQKIADYAKKAGVSTTLANMPLIYLSNKIVFQTALKGFRPLQTAVREELTGALAGKVLVKNAATKTAEFVNKNSWRGVKNIFKPGNLIKGSLRYTAAQLSEGLQEVSQEVISHAYKEYYDQYYKDPNLASLKGSFAHGIGTQMSAQGLSTFLSGFLMGGVLQGPQRLVFQGIPNLSQKIFDPAGYKKYQDSKNEYINSVTNAMNDVYNQPGKYVSSISKIDKNFVHQKAASNNINQSVDENDQKSFHDTKEESIFNHIHTLLQSGQTTTLTDQVKALKELTPEELSEAFGEDYTDPKTGQNLHQKLDSFADKVDYLKQRYNTIEESMRNPFDPSKIKRSDTQAVMAEYMAKEEYDHLKKMALFSRYSFDRTLDRMTGITRKVASSKPLANAPSNDFTLLMSPQQIQDEISTLQLEIPTYNASTDLTSKQTARKKSAKLDALKEFRTDLAALQQALADRKVLGEEVIAAQNKKLFKSYEKYIRSIAGLHQDHVLDDKVAESFTAIKDFYELHQDSISLASSINYLANPSNLKEYLTRAIAVRKAAEENKVEALKEGLQDFISRSEHNQLMNQLFNIGVFFDADSVDALINKDIIPTRFYDAVKFGEIDPESEKGKQVQEILDRFQEATGKKTPEEAKPTEETPVVSITQATPIEQIPGDLLSQLVSTFRKVNAERDEEEQIDIKDKDDIQVSKMSAFKSWFQVAKIARDIVSKYNSTKPVITEIKISKPAELKIAITPTGIISNENLKSWDLGSLEGTEETRAVKNQINDLIRNPDRPVPGGESFAVFTQRIIPEVKRVFEEAPNGTLIIVDSQIVKLIDQWYKQNMPDVLSKQSLENVITEDDQGPAIKEFKIGEKIIYMTSHGESDQNKDVKGAPTLVRTKDADLAEKGIEEAHTLGKELASKNISSIISSSLPRALKTADIIKEEIDESKKPKIEETPEKTLEERFAMVTNLEMLDELDERLVEDLMDPTQNISAEEVARLMEEKRRELALEISFENIRPGEVLIMTDKKFFGQKGLALVVEKTDKEIKVRKFADAAGSIRAISKGQIKHEVEFKYNEGAENVNLNPPVSEEENKITEQSIKNVQDSQGQPENKDVIKTDLSLDEIEKQQKQAEDDLNDDFKKC